MSLTGMPLIVLLALGSVAGPVLLGVWLARRRAGRRVGGKVGAGFAAFGSVVVCQVLLVGTVFAVVNRSYGFYSSWSDLLGTGTHVSQIQTAAVPPGSGRVVSLTVHGRVSRSTGQVLVWLPPEYDLPAFRHHQFPVVMMLAGYPGSPTATLDGTQLPTYELQAVAARRAAPFVAVFPPITIRPGLDTECVNFPHGPLAESWITRDVRSAVLQKFRVSRSGRQWAIGGISAGGYCAANLYLRNRSLFTAAVSLGGYFAPAFGVSSDRTLAAQQRALVAANSPIDTYRRRPPVGANLLYVTSKTDPESWQGAPYADGRQMVAVAGHVPGFATIYVTGGHHFGTWQAALPQVMSWLGQLGI